MRVPSQSSRRLPPERTEPVLNISVAGWLIIALAALAANLPFVNERLFGFLPVPRNKEGKKSIWWRLLELLVLYFIVGAFAYLLESRAGNVFTQRWEFYAVTVFAFLVLAYPGYVFRYLRKRRL